MVRRWTRSATFATLGAIFSVEQVVRNFWLMGGLALLVLGAAGCADKADQLAERVENGQRYLAQGQFVEARAEANGALQLDPSDAAAIDLQARVTEKLQRPRDAIPLYQGALERNPAHAGARLRLGWLLLAEDALDEASEHAAVLLKNDPVNAAALALRAAIHARRANPTQAAEDARAALRIDPHQVDAVIVLADLAVRGNDAPQSLAILNAALAQQPQNMQLRGALTEGNVRQGQPDMAMNALRENLRIAPLEFAQRARLSELLVDMQLLDEAETVLRAGITVQPENHNAHLALVNFIARHRDKNIAERLLVNYIAQKPQALELRLALAQFYEGDIRRDRAAQIYREVIAGDRNGFDGQAARLKLAQLLMQMGQRSEAESLLDYYLEVRRNDVEALLLRAASAMERGAYDRAVTDIRLALSHRPDSASAWRLLARAQAAQNDINASTESYRRAIEADPRDAEAVLGYAQVQLRQGNVDAAIAILQEFLRRSPADFTIAGRLLDLYLKRSDWQNSTALAGAMKSAAPEKGWGEYLAGLTFLARKNPSASIAQFEAALQKNPQFLDALQKLVATHIAQRQPARAIQRIKKTLSQYPQFAPAHNLLGEVSLVQKRFSDAEMAFRRALVADARYIPAISNLAGLRVQRNAADDAVKIYQDGISATQGDPQLMFALATLYEQRGDMEQAVAQYENALARDTHFYAALNNLAMLLATYKPDVSRLARARELVERLKVTDVAAFMDTIGWVYYLAADYEQAVKYLDRAVAELGSIAIVQYHLGMALAKKGDAVAARRALENALRKGEEFPGVDEARATLDDLGKS